MNINDVYGDSKWLKAADLKGRKVKVRITELSTTKFKQPDGSEREQLVVTFAGTDKRLGLNKTNARMIASMHGDEVEDWIGKEVCLFPTKTQNQQGQIVDCIRIEYTAPVRATVKAAVKKMFDERNPPPAEDIPDEMNDEVPF